MKITINKTAPKQIDVPVPSFWHDAESPCDKWAALLDEKTYVNTFTTDNRTCVVSGDPQFHRDEIAGEYGVVAKWKQVTEAEFFEAFERVYKSLSLSPVLAFEDAPRSSHETIILS